MSRTNHPNAAPDDRFNRETRLALLEAVEAATPAQRLTLLALVEHPKLLEAVDVMFDELRDGLR